jgi:hypothetical protein
VVPYSLVHTPSQPLPSVAHTQSLLQSFSRPPGKTCLFYGDSVLFQLSLTMASYALANGNSIAVVDGGNEFNVHLIARFARQRRLNADDLLERIFISRGFTCYQMEQAVVHKLPEFLRSTGARTAMVFGLLETFYDDQAPFREVQQILRRVLEALGAMKRDGVSILVACLKRNVLPAERNQLFTTLAAGVDSVYRIALSEEHQPILYLEKGDDRGTDRSNVHEHHRPGAVKLVQVPPGTAQRRPRTVR